MYLCMSTKGMVCVLPVGQFEPFPCQNIVERDRNVFFKVKTTTIIVGIDIGKNTAGILTLKYAIRNLQVVYPEPAIFKSRNNCDPITTNEEQLKQTKRHSIPE